MNDERDELLREIGAALTIEPSPPFAAGVRERVAAEPPSLWARRGLWWSVAGAAACAATIAALVVANRSPVTPTTVVTDATNVAAVPAPVRSPSGQAAVAGGASDFGDSGTVARSPRVARGGADTAPRRETIIAATALAARPDTAAGPDMTVVTNQGAILRAVWSRVAVSGVAVTEAGTPPAVASVPTPPDPVATPIVVSEIKIDPIVFLRLDSPVAPLGSPAGGVRKVIADDSARSKE